MENVEALERKQKDPDFILPDFNVDKYVDEIMEKLNAEFDKMESTINEKIGSMESSIKSLEKSFEDMTVQLKREEQKLTSS
eukprot:maker-scaffold_6-snap-gene-11.60-mRNA-1 protein AED:0.00 eAED:0.00 QI:54/1/1/1/1/1/3/60/80